MRDGLRAEMAVMKDGLRGEIGEVRADVQGLKGQIARLDEKIDKKSVADRLWMILIMGTMMASLFGVMAHGFKWI
jgi:hypothetical protein